MSRPLARVLSLAIVAALGSGVVAASAASPMASGGPDGSGAVAPPPGRIAFARMDEALGGFTTFTIASDGTDERALLPGLHEIPRWSPDGSEVSVTANTASGQVVPSIVRADGTGYRELAFDPTLGLGCAGWSPDGTRLVCEAWDDSKPDRAGIYTLLAADGSGLTRLTESRDVPGGYSPDGTRLVFVRLIDPDACGGELWVSDADGSDARRLIDRTVGLETSFSPDGQSILADGCDGSVFTVDADSGAVTLIPVRAGPVAYEARWSPDGKWVIVSVHIGDDSQPDLVAMRLDGSSPTVLTHTPGVLEEMADWSSP